MYNLGTCVFNPTTLEKTQYKAEGIDLFNVSTVSTTSIVSLKKSVCPHGSEQKNCQDCVLHWTSSQGETRWERKEYGDSSEHEREWLACKDCSVSDFCEHGRFIFQSEDCRLEPSFKECDRSDVCVHRKEKRRCKNCRGSVHCEHGRRKQFCKEYGASAFSEHSRIRRSCKEFGGAALCENRRQRLECRDCGGSSICEHGRVKYKCTQCGGPAICIHAKVSYWCMLCKGASSGTKEVNTATMESSVGIHPFIMEPADENSEASSHHVPESTDIELDDEEPLWPDDFQPVKILKHSTLFTLPFIRFASLRK